jgi:hypothetical protein
MVIPKIKRRIFAGRSILCVIKLSSINGDAALLSKLSSWMNEENIVSNSLSNIKQKDKIVRDY